VRDNGGDSAEAARYLEIPLGLVQAAVTYGFRAEKTAPTGRQVPPRPDGCDVPPGAQVIRAPGGTAALGQAAEHRAETGDKRAETGDKRAESGDERAEMAGEFGDKWKGHLCSFRVSGLVARLTDCPGGSDP
jgi:hypothetical protein